MSADEIFGILVPVTFVGFLITERLFPRREYPPIRFWNLIGFGCLIHHRPRRHVAANALAFVGDEPSCARGITPRTLGGIVIGYPVTALAMALVHRSCHAFHPLWLMGHQVHHSPRRLDIPGSAVFHPLDMALLTATSTIVSVFVLGLDPVAAAGVGYVGAVYGMFQHWNVKTPRWIGYVIQRPEAHGLHHELGVHARNYSDFPLWDILMGTSKTRRPSTVTWDSPAMLRSASVPCCSFGTSTQVIQRQRFTRRWVSSEPR